jgi:hypothetical protein
MLKQLSSGGRRRRVFATALAAAAGAVLASGTSDAHFRLVAPDSLMVLDTQGNPQKTGPCGNEAPQTPSAKVATFRAGQTITVQLVETVPHPGHYRVAIAASQNQLPAEPPVSPPTGNMCDSVPIIQNPALPVLVDGALVHTTPLTGTQTISVPLPPNFTCTNCVLQIIEFMSNHTKPCFYHHCATISIQGAAADGGPVSDAAKEASLTPDGGGSGGAGGSAAGAGGSGGAAGDTGMAGSSGGTDPTTSTGVTTTGSGGSTTVGTAGAGSTTTIGSGTGGSTGAMPGSTDPGCTCSLPRPTGRSEPALASLLLLGLALGARLKRGAEGRQREQR